MAIIKCKMCGGDLEIAEELTVAECEYCGGKQTIPASKDENLVGLFNRANVLRSKAEFDRAESLYEKIIQSDETQAEAYWGLILCKYGIEYVEDPTTFNRVPTCHRASFDSVVADDDYKAAIKYADAVQKSIYEKEATEIDRIQKEILALSQKEEPYDVFICYKETDETGKRTQDSVIANDIYHQLTQEGFKVFYAAITLENKLGSAYEPCIFAALNSAKVMLAIGTKSEYFNAVWVKNEWSRFLKIIKKDSSKLLIPCYRDMDAYELPDEFAHLQAQDMSKIGFINDLVRGIKKIIVKDVPKPEIQKEVVHEVVQTAGGATVESLLKRGMMFLEDSEWENANEYFDKVLDINPEHAEAYLGKLMVDLKVKTKDRLSWKSDPFDGNSNYRKAFRFADEPLKDFLTKAIHSINKRNEESRLEGIYVKATKLMESNNESAYKEAAELFKTITEYKNSQELHKKCIDKYEELRKANIYKNASSKLDNLKCCFGETNGFQVCHEAIKGFESLGDYKDSKEKLAECNIILENAKIEQEKKKIADEEARLERLRIEEQERIQKEIQAKWELKVKFIGTGVIATIIAIIVIVIMISNAVATSNAYKTAIALEKEGKYIEAIMIFDELDDYKDAEEHNFDLRKKVAVTLSSGRYHTIALKSDNSVVATGRSTYRQCDVKDWSDIVSISAGIDHTIGLKSDGTVVAAGMDVNNVSEWKDMVSISAGFYHTVGLKKDGTVIATGNNSYNQCNVEGWTDIVSISTDGFHTIGLKCNGTVVATGGKGVSVCNVENWADIVSIFAGYERTIGLKKDGTVVATGNNEYGQCDVDNWTDIVSVYAHDYHTIGLKKDGTVVATGNNEYGQCDVGSWTDIVSITVGYTHTIGLKKDGTVVATGNNEYGQCDVDGWTDIVSVPGTTGDYTVGLKKDGTVVAVGINEDGQCDVSGWKDIKLPE